MKMGRLVAADTNLSIYAALAASGAFHFKPKKRGGSSKILKSQMFKFRHFPTARATNKVHNDWGDRGSG